MSPRQYTVGVIGHFADSNHGDDACPLATMHNLQALRPDVQFVLICRFPDNAAKQFRLPAYPVKPLKKKSAAKEPEAEQAAEETDRSNRPDSGQQRSGMRELLKSIPLLPAAVRSMRTLVNGLKALPVELRFLMKTFRLLRDVDLLVYTGSNPIFDYFGGFWNYPFTLLKWTIVSKLARTRIAYASVGAGPIVSSRCGVLLAKLLNRSDYVSFRDQRSLNLMRSYGLKSDADVFPDLANSLPVPVFRQVRDVPRCVGINPMPVHHSDFWPETDDGVKSQYLIALAELTAQLVKEGYEVFFYGTQNDDRITANEVQNLIASRHANVEIPEFRMPASVPDLIECCLDADILVTTRYHGAVFSGLTRRPILAICYQGKTREVMEAAGLDTFAIDFEDAEASVLRRSFELLVRDYRTVCQKLEDRARASRQELHALYQNLSRLLPDSSACQAVEDIEKVLDDRVGQPLSYTTRTGEGRMRV